MIEELIEENKRVEKELQNMLRLAKDRNEQIYQVMQNKTFWLSVLRLKMTIEVLLVPFTNPNVTIKIFILF